MGDYDRLSTTELTKLFNEHVEKNKCDEYKTIKDKNTSRMPTRAGLTHEEINEEKQLKKECETFQEILKAVKKRLKDGGMLRGTGRKTKISRRNKSKTHKKSKKSSKTRKSRK